MNKNSENFDKYHNKYEFEPEYNVECEYVDGVCDLIEEFSKETLRTRFTDMPEWVE